MSAGIDLDNVCCDFGKFRAVDHVNVNIQPGEFFSFLGPSGCGKTTILRMISGFTEPTEGVIRIGGKDVRGQRPNQRPTALIFQNLALFPLMPIWENIAFGLEVRGVPKAKRRERAEELLALVDLHDSADKMVSQLSGGQKQRVAIARALAVEPAVMLLDEPLSALDLKLRQHMRAELRAIQKRTGVTFIYITHDQGEALAMSDRVGVMSQGRLQQVANPRDIYNTFRARLPGAEGKLYIRPEHMVLQAKASKENSVAVTLTEVAFEGNFVSVHGVTEGGKNMVAELRYDGSTPIPSAGAQMHMVFDARNAAILPDSATAGA